MATAPVAAARCLPPPRRPLAVVAPAAAEAAVRWRPSPGSWRQCSIALPPGVVGTVSSPSADDGVRV